MWSDNDIDTAFQRLSPPEPEPAPFPLDAWLRLETQLDKAVIERAVRRRVWQFFAAEVAVVALAVLGWLLWPSQAGKALNQTTETTTVPPKAGPRTLAAGRPASEAGAPAATVSATTRRPASAATSTTAATASREPASNRRTGETLPNNSAAAVVQAEFSRATATVSPASTKPNRPKLSATKLLAARYQSPRATATETAFARTSREPAVNSFKPTAQLKAPAAASSTASETPAMAVAAKLPADAQASKSASLMETRSQAKDAPAATATLATTTLPPAATAAPEPNLIPETGTTFLALQAYPVMLQLAAVPALPTPLPAALSAEPAAPVVPPAPGQQPRFQLGLVAAPDVSTVKFTKVQAPMPNLGLTLEYRFSSRLRLSTGLLRSTKQYSARREDYDWGAYATRVYQRDFADVDATCTVLDVPLNLRYDLLTRPRYLLVGSVGLSSFFMQREHYTYAYVENNMPQRWQRDAVNENRHLLSILNLSVGYEGCLSDHWSFQAEPYLKLPLAGVGAGQVRLTSAGVFVGVKYGFN